MRIQVYTLVRIYFPLPIPLKFFNRFENLVLIPNIISFPVLLGLAARQLNPSNYLAVSPPSAARIISFGTIVASSNVSWCAVTPDCGVYHDSEASS